MSRKKVLAWHFLPADKRLLYGDGRLVRVGETLSVPTAGIPIKCCHHGLHASLDVFDAYCFGPILGGASAHVCRVAMSGQFDLDDNKFAAERRKVLWMVPWKAVERFLPGKDSWPDWAISDESLSKQLLAAIRKARRARLARSRGRQRPAKG